MWMAMEDLQICLQCMVVRGGNEGGSDHKAVRFGYISQRINSFELKLWMLWPYVKI